MRNYSISLSFLYIFIFSCKEPKIQEFYTNGNLKSEVEISKGYKNGIEVNYYKSGQIKSKYNYINDTLNGCFYEYYKDGVIESYGFIKKGALTDTLKLFYQNGRMKEWRIYDANGNVKDYSTYNEIGDIIDEKIRFSIVGLRGAISIKDSMNIVLKLENEIFDKMEVVLGNLNKDFNLSDTTLVLRSNDNQIDYLIKPSTRGDKRFTGVVKGIKKLKDKTIIKSMSFTYFYKVK